MLALEYNREDSAAAERIGNFWTSRRLDGAEGSAWLPLSVVDSGFGWWSPERGRTDYTLHYREMVAAAQSRRDTVSLEAAWSLLGQHQAYVDLGVTNTGTADLTRSDSVLLDLLLYQSGHPRYLERLVRSVQKIRLGDLESGATLDLTETIDLPADVDVGLLDLAVVVSKYRAGQGFESLQAVIACTDRPTPVPTSTPTPTATRPTPTPGPTQRPRPAYLPILFNPPNRCVKRLSADITLVVDLSTSMLRETTDGVSKHLAAVHALNQILDKAHMSEGADGQARVLSEDQIAVVGFNATGWIQQPLTTSRVAADAAVGSLSSLVAEYTRTDLGLQAGLEAATGPWHRSEDARQVMILLTDGLPNRVPVGGDGTMESTVLAAAKAVQQKGIELYAVGFGADADVYSELLIQMVGPSRFWRAKDAAELDAVFERLAKEYECPTDLFIDEPR